MKTEPDVFSIDNLKKDGTTWWEGVRNYQARNFMNEMSVGDEVLFYHSSATPSGLAGLAVISEKAKPDASQFDKKSEYYDPKATKEKPIWFCTQVKYKKTFKKFIPLEEIKNDKNCADLLVIRKGQRLSIQPVSEKDFLYLSKLGAG